jgi:hypothetical protein
MFILDILYFAVTGDLYLKARILAGSNNANGIIPQKFVIATQITPSTSKTMPTAFILALTTNVIINMAIYRKKANAVPAKNGLVLDLSASCIVLSCSVGLDMLKKLSLTLVRTPMVSTSPIVSRIPKIHPIRLRIW